MGRLPKFKYLDSEKGGIIIESQVYPSIQRAHDLPFVSLELLDDNRYRIWAGNERVISYTLFFPMTTEGFTEAVEEYKKFIIPEMTKKFDWTSQEFLRLSILEDKPQYKREKIAKDPVEKQKYKRRLQLRNLLSDMIEKNQIDETALVELFKSLK